MNRYNYTGCDKVYGETYNYIVERKLIVWKLKRLSYIKLVNRAGMRACERKGGGRVTRTGGEGIRSLRKDRGSRKKERKRGPKARSDQSRRNDRRPVISRASTQRQVPRPPRVASTNVTVSWILRFDFESNESFFQKDIYWVGN